MLVFSMSLLVLATYQLFAVVKHKKGTFMIQIYILGLNKYDFIIEQKESKITFL